jgi:predicted GIY-YIG superfamily endonuclease
MERNWIVYLLKNTRNRYTYLGATNDSKNRIRRHNGEIKGGARYTKIRKGKGKWKYHFRVSNLTKHEALSIERTAKNKRRSAVGKTPLDKRMNILKPIIVKYPHCLKWTDKKRKRKSDEDIPKRKRRKI